jgi:AraC family transcriptional regulator, regulatory protein of adaptative response / DNA-3-methyladenine glycosylase II
VPSNVERVILEFLPPYAIDAALATLAAHTIPGAEVTNLRARSHTRLLWDSGMPGVGEPVAVTVRFHDDHIVVESDATCLAWTESLVRRWLDLDVNPQVISAHFGSDPIIGPLTRERAGLRVLGYPSGFEAAVTTVLGQQVSLAACRTFAGRLVAAFGVPGPRGLTVFPTPEQLAAATPEQLQNAVGLTGARSRTVHALAVACADGLRLDPHGDHAEVRRRLLAVSGIGPWSADYLAVRALGDRNAFVPGDLVLRKALGGITAKQAELASAAWSPYRAYALFHLWTATAYVA